MGEAPGTLRCPACAEPLEGAAHRWWSYRVETPQGPRTRVLFECLRPDEARPASPGEERAE